MTDSTSSPGSARDHDIKMLMGSRLFDIPYYSRKYALTGMTDRDVVSHYLDNFLNCPETSLVFSGKDYYENNKDVAKAAMNPLEHYLRYGMKQERRFLSETKCIELFEHVDPLDTASIADIVPQGQKVRVLYTTAGNFFFQDIAEYVAESLRTLGWTAQVMSDRDAREGEKGWFDLVVAPHEYMLIGPGYLWSEERQREAAYFNTEQWQTPWFASCLKHLYGSIPGVIDLNPTSAAAFAKLGIRAAFLPLVPLANTAFQQRRATFSKAFARRKYVELLQYPGDIADRQYDVLFVANLNPRRQELVARLAGDLAPLKSFIHAPIMDKPVKAGDGDMLSGRDFTQLALNSKILLNIHRDEIGYFEWHRLFLYGISNGTVVITEPCYRAPLLEPGVHYLEASIADIPDLITTLVSTPAGIERLRSISRACLKLCAETTLSDMVKL
jgi:hypothetical protein